MTVSNLPATPDDHAPVRTVLEGPDRVSVVITSFGYLHPGGAPTAHLTVDLRELLHNPHADPAMRELTGLDPAVRDHVLTTPGAADVLDGMAASTAALWRTRQPQWLTTVAIGCAGGRHRSVALANALAHRINASGAGASVQIVHRDILRPVVQK
jgi:UPF0042 nucleotide-binding protein